MTPSLADALVADFPLVYAVELPYGFECGNGWEPLIRRLSVKLQRLINKLPKRDQRDTHAVQVKQKFGGLRFYLACPSEAMYLAIRDAEQESFGICEDCGKPGKTARGRGNWVATLCQPCQVKAKQ